MLTLLHTVSRIGMYGLPYILTYSILFRKRNSKYFLLPSLQKRIFRILKMSFRNLSVKLFIFNLWRSILISVELRSSRSEVFCEKGLLNNFAKFTGKHKCQSLSFNKVARLRPATFLKKRLWYKCFPVNFAEFLRTSIFYRTPLEAAFCKFSCTL